MTVCTSTKIMNHAREFSVSDVLKDGTRVTIRAIRPDDRDHFLEAFRLLEGWRFRRFTGVKDEWPEACETGIFRRPR